ncbi:MAG: PD-(D/E)XK nuclease family protein [Thermoguttaceae bacterium]|nr:PD-(D/E)XK nuclease family protein [Thermoguttaceae bacterium]
MKEMRETIVLAPGLDGNELSSTLALYGVNLIGVRICNAAELARIALMRSGKSIPKEIIGMREETAVIAGAGKGEMYFGDQTYFDIKGIAGAVRKMRCLAAGDNEDGSLRKIVAKERIFREKNRALLNVYKKYMEKLADEGKIDCVSLIRMAAAESDVIKDVDFVILEEYPLNPLERKLLQRVSGGNVPEPRKILDLFKKQKAPVKIDSFRNCYGAANEVEMILSDIYSSGTNLDHAVVAAADTAAYGQLFWDYALRYEIPMTFGCGVPVVNSSPGKLLKLYYNWVAGNFVGDAVVEMLSDNAFRAQKLVDKFLEKTPESEENDEKSKPKMIWKLLDKSLLNNLKLTNVREKNKEILDDFEKAVREDLNICHPKSKDRDRKQKKLDSVPYLRIVSDALSLPVEDFIREYAYIRKGSRTKTEKTVMLLDNSALNALCAELHLIAGMEQNRFGEDVIPSLLKMNVLAQRAEEGKLHVTGIENAFSSVRDHLYIAGLSASNFPGSPKENYLLLDDDLEAFGTDGDGFTANKMIERKAKRLMALAELASSLGAKISVSYAGLDVSELKRKNASSLMLELFKKVYGEDKTVQDLRERTEVIGYFKPEVSVSRLVGDAYAKHRIFAAVSKTPPPFKEKDGSKEDYLAREYSSSALDTYFQCPRLFLLKYILGIHEPEDDSPFEVISSSEVGTLAHSLMEALGDNRSMSRDDFLKLSEAYFDRFIREHRPLIPSHVESEKKQFLEMMKTAYDMDPHREIVLKEEDVHCQHPSGVKLHGFPDRVEKLDNGTYLIVDFKTGGENKHKEDDIGTCLQVVLYACLMEGNGYKVSGGEYRYLRQGEIVTCRYDETMKKALDCKMEKFVSTIREFNDSRDCDLFRHTDGKDPCKYCKYKEICGKETE